MGVRFPASLCRGPSYRRLASSSISSSVAPVPSCRAAPCRSVARRLRSPLIVAPCIPFPPWAGPAPTLILCACPSRRKRDSLDRIAVQSADLATIPVPLCGVFPLYTAAPRPGFLCFRGGFLVEAHRVAVAPSREEALQRPFELCHPFAVPQIRPTMAIWHGALGARPGVSPGPVFESLAPHVSVAVRRPIPVLGKRCERARRARIGSGAGTGSAHGQRQLLPDSREAVLQRRRSSTDCCRARGTDRNWTRVDRKMLWSPAASSSQQRARVLTDVKARRFAPPPLRGADAPAPRG